MSAQVQTMYKSKLFEHEKIKINVKAPVRVRIESIVYAIVSIARIKGYEFISMTHRGYGENRYTKYYLYKTVEEMVYIIVKWARREIFIEAFSGGGRKVFVIDPEDFRGGYEKYGSVYHALGCVIRALGFKETATLDEPGSEGIEFRGYGKKIQLWNHYELTENNKWIPSEVEVVIEDEGKEQ